MARSHDQDRYTYRFIHRGRAQEVHADSMAELQNRALNHLEQGKTTPVHIRRGKAVVLDIMDILDLWEEKFLK